MANNFVRVLATAIISFVFNATLIDGIIFNALALIFTKRSVHVKKLQPKLFTRYEWKISSSIVLLVCSLYLLVNNFNQKFLLFKKCFKKSNAKRQSCVSAFFFVGLPLMALIYFAIVFSILAFDKSNDNNKATFRVQKNAKSLAKIPKTKKSFNANMFLKKLKSLKMIPMRLKSSKKGKNKKKISKKSEPFNLIKLDYLKIYHYEFRYRKIQIYIISSIFLFLFMTIKLNC